MENKRLNILLADDDDRLSQFKLFQRLECFAARICYRYHPDNAEASDILSEAFLKFFKNIGSFDPSRREDPEIGLRAWFKKIIINTSIDHLRKNASKKRLKHVPEFGEMVDSQENGPARLEYKEIIQAIRLLPPAYRAVFNLFVIEGMKHEEIASLLKISVGASKSNLFKARKHLKEILQDRVNDQQQPSLLT